MLDSFKQYCSKNDTTAWVGSPQDLNALGGQDMLYQLEQAGEINATRVGEKWIVTPSAESITSGENGFGFEQMLHEEGLFN